MKGIKIKQNKIIILIILIILSFNFIIGSNVYAVDAEDGGTSQTGESSSTGIKEDLEEGNKMFEGDNFLTTLLEGIVGLLLWPLRLLIVIVGKLMQLIATAIASITGQEFEIVTIEDVLFNNLAITDINFFDINGAGGALQILRKLIAGWYYTLRNLSVVILLCVLVYLGIKMAISTVASEKAIYKKMLVDWMVSFAIIFLIHYIILITININNGLVDIISNAQSSQLEQSGAQYKTYMDELVNMALQPLSVFEGFGRCYYVYYVMYSCIWISICIYKTYDNNRIPYFNSTNYYNNIFCR